MSEAHVPIAFFGFNRPRHTRVSLEALARNSIPPGTPLYAFVDGPKDGAAAEDVAQVEAVREVVRGVAWPGPEHLRFRERNAGLLVSLLGGIGEVLSEHETVIVVEDDVVTSPGFYDFLSSGLETYADEPRVMHLSAHSPLTAPPADYPHTTFVFNDSTVWGWATWRRAWSRLSTDGAAMRREIARRGMRNYVNLEGTFEKDYALQVLDEGRSQDWNAYWHCSILLNDGLCIHPVASLVENIGFDGTGTQCTTESGGLLTPAVDRLAFDRVELVERPELRALALKPRSGNRFPIWWRYWARKVRDALPL